VSSFYLNNPLLKASSVPINFTQEQIEEVIKCTKDPIYFIKNYCKIISLDKGLINFELYEYQEKFILDMHNNNRIISMQPRQMGKTQTVAAYLLYYAIFNDHKTVAILANKASASREIMSRFQLMYEHLPKWLQQGVVTWNKGDIELENGSKVFTAATSGAGIRGKSVNFLYVDEAAIIPNTVAEDFFTSTYPTISSGKTTKVVLTSTPLGYNHFWKFWNDAVENRNGFIATEVKYWEHPDRDEKWAAQQKELLGELKFNQEVLCAFLGSSLTLVSADIISRMSATTPIYSKDGLDIFEKPEEKNTYVLIADTGKGVGGDYSAFSVVDITQTPYKQVAKYRDNKISPLLYPNIIHKVGTDYNNAYVLIEINSSEQVPTILYTELEYENMLFINRTSKGQVLTGGFGNGAVQLGVNTDRKIKRIGCTNFKSLVEENKLLIMDVDTISEISTFIERRGSYSADDGYHDDLVMPLVLFGWLISNPYFKELNNVNLRTEMFEAHIKHIENELTPFGFYDDGVQQESVSILSTRLPEKNNYELTEDQIELLNF
jgi:hypothetical protein